MFCPECGATIPDEAKFCTKCGALTAREEAPETATAPTSNLGKEAESIEQIASAEPTPGLEEPEPAPKKKAKPKIVAAVVAAVLAICGIGGFAAYSHSQNQVYTLLAAPVADGYDAEDATPMPVEVTGTDHKGNEVDEIFYVTPNDGIEMPRGEYTIKFPDPIASGSNFFVPGGEATRARVGDGGWTIIVGDEEQAADSIEVTFQIVAPEDVTDDMIDQLRGWMEKAGLSESEISKFADAVTNARQERLDQIAAEEEAARKAEEERRAAEEAARRIDSPDKACQAAINYYCANNDTTGLNVGAEYCQETSNPAGHLIRVYNDKQTHASILSWIIVEENGTVHDYGYTPPTGV